MKDLFLFSGFISYDHSWSFIFHVILTGIVCLLIARAATSSMQLVPRGTQNIAEAYLMGVMTMGRDTFGSEELARKYLPMIATVGFMVLIANVMGIIPGFHSPTADINYTLALAIIVFLYYNFEGIRTNGFKKYFGHFMGPSPLLAPIMFPVEILSHMSRVVSLSFRLFGCIRGDDLFLAIILVLAPWIAPLAPYTLLTVMGLLQTFVFMMLTTVYLAGAVIISEDH
ncbi:F0F1 ATP synthase subunit A [Sulfurospirillum sp. T05]|uniref:ATP synthase subunit a n=1 Tax=Sulfurospirillum tamanense TaxID=2813362 RepID=A0ABS2WSD1_9BACT|nr:F0F1 ATP synthase subunit A [Sulfurospirillum tamanensis]MBN2964522.1 F0F1 ATP synthase subunit A [Sulfurospirillum tamanensis]